jgi:hypothetical protein
VRTIGFLGAVVVATLVALLPASAADIAPHGSVQVSLVPSGTKTTDPRQLAYVVEHVQQGATVQRTIQVANTTDQALPIALYPDAATIAHGDLIPGPGRTENALTSWTSVTPPLLLIGPHRAQSATVTISVPATADNGEQYGVIWAQPPASSVPNGPIEINRVGIRIYFAVGTGIAPADFQITGVTTARPTAHAQTVAALVHNTGGVALDVAGRLLLVDPRRQLQAGPYLSTRSQTLAPGDVGSVVFGVPRHVPGGSWDAKVSLTSGSVQHDASARLHLAGPAPGATGASSPNWLLFATGAVGILGVIWLVVWVLASLLRRRRSAVVQWRAPA